MITGPAFPGTPLWMCAERVLSRPLTANVQQARFVFRLRVMRALPVPVLVPFVGASALLESFATSPEWNAAVDCVLPVDAPAYDANAAAPIAARMSNRANSP